MNGRISERVRAGEGEGAGPHLVVVLLLIPPCSAHETRSASQCAPFACTQPLPRRTDLPDPPLQLLRAVPPLLSPDLPSLPPSALATDTATLKRKREPSGDSATATVGLGLEGTVPIEQPPAAASKCVPLRPDSWRDTLLTLALPTGDLDPPHLLHRHRLHLRLAVLLHLLPLRRPTCATRPRSLPQSSLSPKALRSSARRRSRESTARQSGGRTGRRTD